MEQRNGDGFVCSKSEQPVHVATTTYNVRVGGALDVLPATPTTATTARRHGDITKSTRLDHHPATDYGDPDPVG